MYVTSILFKREKESKWEQGYYIGDTDNSVNSTILDKNYQPLQKDENGCSIWEYTINIKNRIQFRCEEPKEEQRREIAICKIREGF